MSYQFYKFLHLIGILSLFLATGGMMFFRFAGLDKSGADKKAFRMLIMTHGLALFVTLLGGFGLIAKLELLSPWPVWVFVKMGVWLCLGGGLVLFKKCPKQIGVFLPLSMVLGAAAAYMAVFKPF